MPNQDAPKSAKSTEKFVVRLPPGMRRRIADAARGYRRSMNSEIVARLEQSLDSGDPPCPATEQIPVAAVQDAPAPGIRPAGALPAEGDQEHRLLHAFRNLSPERRRALLALLD